jgi:hypothetical protein
VPSLRPRAPDATELERFFNNNGVSRLRDEANGLSTVVELLFGETPVVLAGDLPRYYPGSEQPVATGWDLVMSRHPHLGDHTAMKLPHHGSAEAFHPMLMCAADGKKRAWIATPFNSSRLPRVTEVDGLPSLLQVEPTVHLTALSASRRVQAAVVDGRVTLGQLEARTKAQPTGQPFLDAGIDIRPGTALGPLDPVWCIAFDATQSIVGRWRWRYGSESRALAIEQPTVKRGR